jgi:hypothetical protein
VNSLRPIPATASPSKSSSLKQVSDGSDGSVLEDGDDSEWVCSQTVTGQMRAGRHGDQMERVLLLCLRAVAEGSRKTQR